MRWATRIACFLLLPALALAGYIGFEEHAARQAKAQMRALEIDVVNQTLMRAIRRYTAEQGRPPKTVDDLVALGYFKGFPQDLIDDGYFKGMPRLGPVYFDPAIPSPPGRPRPVTVPTN